MLSQMSTNVASAFAGLAPAWRSCFLLAWESFQCGSIPIGAVLVDAAGRTVSAGRNRRNEREGPSGQVAGSNVAHAELNALAALPAGEYADHVLYSTLEPCLLCTAALRHSHVGTVRFAADDPMWDGMERVPDLNRHLARRWARREGPIDGPLRTWAALLPLISVVERGVESVQHCYVERAPALLELAQLWAGARADALREMDLDGALAAAWPHLSAR